MQKCKISRENLSHRYILPSALQFRVLINNLLLSYAFKNAMHVLITLTTMGRKNKHPHTERQKEKSEHRAPTKPKRSDPPLKVPAPWILLKENDLNRIDGGQVYREHSGRLPLPDFPPTKYLTADKYDYTVQIEFPEDANGVRHYSFPAFYRSESPPRDFYFCTSGNPASELAPRWPGE